MPVQMEAPMTTVKEMRTSIDQTLDRWNAAALALEENINATQAAVSERIQTQKEKAAEASEKLEKAIERAQQLPSDAREKIVGDLGHLKVQLALGKVEARDAVLAQKEKIGQAVQRVENQIDQIEQQVDQKIKEATEEWVRADQELQQELELAALRFENEKAEKRVQFEAKKQEMLDNVKQFREAIEEKRIAAQQKGSTFASDMTASFEQMRTAFRNLAG
jgi:phage-related minor tail protein